MDRVRLSSRTLSSSCQCLRQYTPSTTIGVRSYNVSRFSPIQPPPVTSPTSPYFVPRKLGQTTRLSTYYDETVAPNMLLMCYDPTAKREKQLLPLRWDGTSPYHKNRPQPRVQIPPKLHHPMNTKNIPKIESITVHSMVKSSIVKRPDLLNAALAVQSITGQRPDFIHSKSSVQAFKLRPRIAPPKTKVNNRYPYRGKNCIKRSCDVGFSFDIIRGGTSSSKRFRRSSLCSK